MKAKFRYKVRLTRMLNTWVEVKAKNPDEAESLAYDEVVRKGKDDPCWSDDDDVQVESDTLVKVNGRCWRPARFAAKRHGGEGVPEIPEEGL